MDSLWEKIFTHTNTVNTDSNIKAQENTINPNIMVYWAIKQLPCWTQLLFFFFFVFFNCIFKETAFGHVDLCV